MTPVQKLHQRKDFDQFLTSLETKNILGVTCAGKTDGAGAQALAIMSTLLFCRMTGVDYFHTPFETIAFDDGAPDWPGRWEAFFNLGYGEALVPEGATVLTPDEYIAQGEPDGVILKLVNCHAFVQADNTADMFEDIRPELREKYDALGDKPDLEATDILAVHVRRGDVQADNRYKGRFVDEAQILIQIAEVQSAFDAPLPVHIFSQGEAAQFPELAKIPAVTLRLDEDVFTTFHAMASARALIATRSALSYTAGLYNRGIVRSDNWYHKPLSAWRFEYFSLELETTPLVVSDPEYVATTLRAAPTQVASSDLLLWNYAQGLTRTRHSEAAEVLEKVVLSGSMYARAASSTLCGVLKGTARTDPDGLERAQARHRKMFDS